MNKTLLAIFSLFAFAVTADIILPPIGGGGGSVISGSITGAYAFAASQFTTTSATNIALSDGASATNLNVQGMTNHATLRNTGAAIFSNTVSVSGAASLSSLRVTNASVLNGAVTATNGEIQIGQSGFPVTFGDVDGSVDPGGDVMTNRYVLYQRGQFLMNDAGQSMEISSGAFLNITADSYLRLVGKATPTITTAGQLTFDTDAWAASVGAFYGRDGTRSNYLVGVDATDAPSNGQVIKWNTGGRITWEDDTGSGSVATDTIWNAAGDLVYGTGSDAATRLAIGTAGHFLRVNAGATAPEWAAVTATAAGNDKELQYNNGGALGASTNLFVDDSATEPKVIIGSKANSSQFSGFIVRGSTGSNHVNHLGMYADDNSLLLGVSNANYQATLTIDASGLLVLGASAPYAGAKISGGWSALEVGRVYSTNSVHAAGGVSGLSFSTTNTPGASPAGSLELFATNQLAKTKLTVSDTHTKTNTLNLDFGAFAVGDVPVVSAVSGQTATVTNKSLVAVMSEYSVVTNVVSGWGIHSLLSANTLTTTLTNRSAGTATNAFTLFADFSDTANKQIYNVTAFSTNALTIATTNLVVGRTLCVSMGTNMVTYSVTVLDMAGAPIQWNFNVATNGATAFTKTNLMAAKLYLTAETNGVLTADFGFYRR